MINEFRTSQMCHACENQTASSRGGDAGIPSRRPWNSTFDPCILLSFHTHCLRSATFSEGTFRDTTWEGAGETPPSWFEGLFGRPPPPPGPETSSCRLEDQKRPPHPPSRPSIGEGSAGDPIAAAVDSTRRTAPSLRFSEATTMLNAPRARRAAAGRCSDARRGRPTLGPFAETQDALRAVS